MSAVATEEQVEVEEGITPKQRELLKRVVKGFTIREIVRVLKERYREEEIVEAINST